MPGLFLSLARNTTIARPGFVSRVLRFAFPLGAIAAAATLLSYATTRVLVPNDLDLARTTADLALIGCGLIILWILARPQRIRQWALVAALSGMPLVILAESHLRAFFAIEVPPLAVWAAVLVIDLIGAITLAMATHAQVHVRERLAGWSKAPRRAS